MKILKTIVVLFDSAKELERINTAFSDQPVLKDFVYQITTAFISGDFSRCYSLSLDLTEKWNKLREDPEFSRTLDEVDSDYNHSLISFLSIEVSDFLYSMNNRAKLSKKGIDSASIDSIEPAFSIIP